MRTVVLAFAPGRTRTFMCAALAAGKDPAEELELAVSLINRVLDGAGVRTGVHVCRGNWSRDERTLLRGRYHSLAPYLERLRTDQLVFEYATERAGDLLRFDGKELGLGSRPMNSGEIGLAKVRAMAQAARDLRG